MKNLTLCIFSFVAGLALAYFLSPKPHAADAPVKIDTLKAILPKAIDSLPARERVVKAPLAKRLPALEADSAIAIPAEADSAEVRLPIVSKEYGDSSTYRLWISGFQPSLDSIHIYRPAPLPPPKPKRWHIGVTAGYAFTSQGFKPYVGIGVTYSFFSF